MGLPPSAEGMRAVYALAELGCTLESRERQFMIVWPWDFMYLLHSQYQSDAINASV
jgi:hypothetical protein